MNKYFVIDLFAGCGGLSEGFRQAGFDVIAQVEMDKWACETLKSRHLYYGLKSFGNIDLYHKYCRQEISREEIFERFPELYESINLRVIQAKFGHDDLQNILFKIDESRKYHQAPRFHVLVGGAPCQPYSIAGRFHSNKLRSIDERNYLYNYYLAVLQHLQPDFFLFENVPGLITAKINGEKIITRILNDFASLKPSYVVLPSLQQLTNEPQICILNSADFQIPQIRKRLFLIGYKQSLEHKNPEIKDIFTKLQKQKTQNEKYSRLTVKDAIGDLPALRPGEGNDGWLGYYNNDKYLLPYQVQSRRDSPGVLNHKARNQMPADIERYKYYIEFYCKNKRLAHIQDLIRERPNLIPNHSHLDKFIDKFRVQVLDKPSTTILAHICKDGYYYIHPDINQCRSFTVREAARCQSFPDNFKFEGSRTEQFRQVGNAVPPLLAREIGLILYKELCKVQ